MSSRAVRGRPSPRRPRAASRPRSGSRATSPRSGHSPRRLPPRGRAPRSARSRPAGCRGCRPGDRWAADPTGPRTPARARGRRIGVPRYSAAPCSIRSRRSPWSRRALIATEEPELVKIEPAVQDRQPARERLAGVAQAHRQRHRQSTPGGVPRDHDRFRVDAASEQLAIGGQRVLERRRVDVLGPESVVEQVHRGPGRHGDLRGERAVGAARADQVATAMEVEHRPAWVGAGRGQPVAGSARRASRARSRSPSEPG